MIFFSLFTCMVSCDNDEDINNFYETDYRIGLWINPDRKDTLDFIDNTNLIRKGDVYKYEEYLYRIEGEFLFIKLPSSPIETQHSIKSAKNNKVVLGNMYPQIGFNDASGTFIKE